MYSALITAGVSFTWGYNVIGLAAGTVLILASDVK